MQPKAYHIKKKNRMKKALLMVVCLMTSALALLAQNESPSILKCIYLEEAINRADQPDKVSQDEFMLAVSGHRSAFYSRNARALSEAKDSLARLGLPAMEQVAVLQSMPKGKHIEIYKNQPETGKYLCYDEIAQCFRYEDGLPQIEWQVEEEARTILGYTCQKATGTLYGREWTVWFTMDIPVSEGPWLLSGLPGLILEATDSEGLFHFSAIELGQDAGNLSVEPVAKKFVKCTRKELMEYRAKFDENPLGVLQASFGVKISQIRNAEGKEMKEEEIKRKRNYYEKE